MNNATFNAGVAAKVVGAIEAAGASVRATALATGIPYTTLDRKLKGAPFHVSELRSIGKFLGRSTESFLPAEPTAKNKAAA